MSKRWEEAENAYLKAIELNPEEPEYYYLLAEIYQGNKDYEKAARYSLQAVQLAAESFDSENSEYISILIDACKKIEKRDLAESFLRQALNSDPENEKVIEAIKSLK